MPLTPTETHDYLKWAFGSQTDDFNQSKVTMMIIAYKKTGPCFWRQFEWLPELGTSMDIAAAIRRFVTVPFTVAVDKDRFTGEHISYIVVTRVFLPSDCFVEKGHPSSSCFPNRSSPSAEALGARTAPSE